MNSWTCAIQLANSVNCDKISVHVGSFETYDIIMNLAYCIRARGTFLRSILFVTILILKCNSILDIKRIASGTMNTARLEYFNRIIATRFTVKPSVRSFVFLL